MWYYASCFTTWVFPKNGGTPKSSVLIGFSIINHPFWGTPIFGNTHLVIWMAFVCRQVVVLLAEKNVSRSEVQRFDFWSCQRPSFWVYKYVPNHWVQGKKTRLFFARLHSRRNCGWVYYLEIMYTKIHEPSWITKHTVDPCVWWMTVNPPKKMEQMKKVHQHTNYINASWSAWFKIGVRSLQ